MDDLDFIFQTLSHETKTSGTHHFCCGECGEIDFLIKSSEVSTLHSTSMELLSCRASALLDQIGNGAFFYGTAGQVHSHMSPDLFQGAAGIGYTLLRLRNNILPTLT